MPGRILEKLDDGASAARSSVFSVVTIPPPLDEHEGDEGQDDPCRQGKEQGTFGAAAAMLIWLYVISRLVTSAAFLNATLWSRRLGSVPRSGPNVP